jgi:hypothetical protein
MDELLPKHLSLTRIDRYGTWCLQPETETDLAEEILGIGMILLLTPVTARYFLSRPHHFRVQRRYLVSTCSIPSRLLVGQLQGRKRMDATQRDCAADVTDYEYL